MSHSPLNRLKTAALCATSLLTLVPLTSCINHTLKPVELKKAANRPETIALTVNKDVDILFVMDNSGSMGEEQGKLAESFSAFIEVLEQDGVEANYRLGVTTTDNGGCSTNTSPEGGKLQLSSCLDRENAFTFMGVETIEVFDIACQANCSYTNSELTITPTTTHVDETPTARPWLESIEGQANIPDGITTIEAFQCFGPQGINGCGWEQHLESMHKALTLANSDDPDVASRGFLRPNALLAIVHLTDEADCSFVDKEIFTADWGKIFWEDPDAFQASSAVCWNAGVSCTGDSSSYDCQPMNFGQDGTPDVADGDAMMRPLSRYISQVQGIENQKKMILPENDVIVALVGGVESDGSVNYADVSQSDPDFNNTFGIGPGCVSGSGDTLQEAVPPVRLRDFTENFQIADEQVMFSVCDQNYGPALNAIAETIESKIQPACYKACVKDVEPATPDYLDQDCKLIDVDSLTDTSVEILECAKDTMGTPDPVDDVYLRDGDSYVQPGDDINVCYIVKNDPGGITNQPHDDMSEQCLDDGFNLEFELQRRPGFPASAGSSVEANCSLADFAQISCPDLN